MQRKPIVTKTHKALQKAAQSVKPARPEQTQKLDRDSRTVGTGENAIGMRRGSLMWTINELRTGESHALVKRIPLDAADMNYQQKLTNLVGQASSTVSRLTRATQKTFMVERGTLVLTSGAMLIIVCITCTAAPEEDDGLGEL